MKPERQAADKVLLAVFEGRVVARALQDRRGRLQFSYEEAWRSFDGAFPLSLSLPLASRTHPHDAIESFFAGLLPDREEILTSWARRFETSRNPFALLGHVGEDCPGAFQFVRQNRLGVRKAEQTLDVQWLTESNIGERIRVLHTDPSAWRAPGDTGQFSLGGAQAKTSLLFHEGRWGIPSGRTPTTHILKPPIPGLDGHVENEHICLELARALGLPVASSQVARFDGETVIVVERFDRAITSRMADAAAAGAASWAATAAGAAAEKSPTGAIRAPGAAARAAEASARAHSLRELAARRPILRLHQEDLCQALAVPPRHKYQNEGGPGPREIVDLLRTNSSQPESDVWTFVDALAFNWLIGGTDAHAKNYSVLHGGGGRVRLAPFYDMASVLPYEALASRDVRLSMRLGGTYRLAEIDAGAWHRLAGEIAVDADELLARVATMTRALPEKLAEAIAAARAGGIDHPILERLLSVLPERANHCLRWFE